MSADDSDSGPGRREVAHRLFAAEFDDATVSYAESDEERAPKYVVTPTGARVNRLFAVGVLTEVESVNEDVLRARVVDPTGAFVSYAGQYQSDAAAFFERADTPSFVALTGKARTFEPDDGDRIYTSVRPESVAEVDAATRDRWTVSAAEATLRRVAAMADARSLDASGDDLRAALQARGYDESLAAGIPIALDRYGTTTAYLDAVRQVALDALEVVAGDRDAVRALDTAPDDAGTTSLGPLPNAVTATDATPAAADDAAETATETAPETHADEPSTTDSSAAADDASAESAGREDTSTETGTEATPTDEPSVDIDAGASDVAEAEADAEADTDVGSAGAESESIESEPTEPAESVAEPADSAPDTGASTGTDADELGDFDDDDLYELDEEERQEVEESYDVGFESGTEVDDPGEAGIDVPGPEDLADETVEAESTPADAEAVTDSAETTADETETTADETATTADETTTAGDADAESESADAVDVDLESVAVDVMDELDDGDGADREEVVARVVDEYGADPGAVADAIEDALMSGKCYEPSEDRLKAI